MEPGVRMMCTGVVARAYHTVHMSRTMELPKEGHFDLAALVVVRFVTFQDLVQTLEEKRPKLPQRSVVPYKFGGVGSVVVIGAYDLCSI